MGALPAPIDDECEANETVNLVLLVGSTGIFGTNAADDRNLSAKDDENDAISEDPDNDGDEVVEDEVPLVRCEAEVVEEEEEAEDDEEVAEDDDDEVEV